VSSELELFDYTFWLGSDDGGVQEALVVRGKPDEETARESIPERSAPDHRDRRDGPHGRTSTRTTCSCSRR
jgi:hypothetical protein